MADQKARFTLAAPAKLNLSLAVQSEVSGGKHLLSSVFTTIGLSDHLLFSYDGSANSSLSIQMRYAAGLPRIRVPQAKNIVYQAIRAFEERFGCALPGKLFVKVQKSIPIQAGLGGGSSDAAAAIKAMQRLCGIDPDPEGLAELAAELGADVSFFLAGGCALMGGVGERLERSFSLPPLDVVLVKPTKGVSTKRVYDLFDKDPEPAADLDAMVRLLSRAGEGAPDPAELVQSLAPLLANNLTAAASTLLPDIADLLEALKQQPGILGALMSGSGSTVFGLAETQKAAEQAAAHFSALGYWACVTQTSSAVVAGL